MTCKLCGKQGVLSLGFPAHVGLVHKHYCSVKAKLKRDVRNKELQKKIDKLINQYDRDDCFKGCNLDFYRELFDHFPYKEVGYFDEPSGEELLYREKYRELERIYYTYLVEKRKIPTEKRVKIFIRQIINEKSSSS